MIRWALFTLLAGGLTAWAFWIYFRVEMAVPMARMLAVVRSVALVLVLLLLFDPRLPVGSADGAPTRWVLLDASLSMAASGDGAEGAWEGARARARELEGAGWAVVTFGGGTIERSPGAEGEPDQLGSRLAPALASAAESGATSVTVLSDLRFEDAVAVRAALETLPLAVAFEGFGSDLPNAGISRLTVPDLLQPEGQPVAEIEVHGGTPGDSIRIDVFEEGRPVASVTVAAPSTGLRTTTSVELPTPAESGRLRYTARTAVADDAFASDDEAVDHVNVGYEAGALVLVSLQPDWEPRHLLPVLEEVTGLPAAGYLRAGADRYVRLGRAVDRGAPADSATVRRAATDAALLVVHGLSGETDEWVRTVLGRPGRRLILPSDVEGAAIAGLAVSSPRTGEWYVSPDVPTSPIAGSIVGADFSGLPPLTGVMVAEERSTQPPLQVQLRGAGAPESAFHLMDGAEDRTAVVLATGFWRWAMREAGREPYRRVWSGVAGWLLSDQAVLAAEARPAAWVMPRGAPVEWMMPADSGEVRLVVSAGDSVVMDTTVAGGGTSTSRALPPGLYDYTVTGSAADTLGAGRFDVTSATAEMLPAREEPEAPVRAAALSASAAGAGRPLRTSPWPYLLVIMLLCGEWIVRRRSGLR